MMPKGESVMIEREKKSESSHSAAPRWSDFEGALLEAVDRGLMILGESVKQTLYFHLERMSPVQKKSIADNPQAFISNLEGIFGAGAKVIEKNIVEQLFSELGLELEEKVDYSFVDYVKEARTKYQKAAPDRLRDSYETLRDPGSLSGPSSKSESCDR